MTFCRLLSVLLLLSLPVSHSAQAAAPVRQRQLIDSGWRFQRVTSAALGHAVSVAAWRREAVTASQTDLPGLETSGPNWQNAAVSEDVFKNQIGFAWYQTLLPNLTLQNRTLHLEGVDDRTSLTADGEDVTMVEVDLVDAAGRIVPTASNQVTFDLAGAGRIAGVGNGDPNCHEPDQAHFRSAFNGKCLVIVGAGETAGRMTLSAVSPGLRSASLHLTSGLRGTTSGLRGQAR